MKYLLDTNILVYWLKGDKDIDRHIQEKGYENIYISVINLAELYYGAFKSAQRSKNISVVEELKKRFSVIDIMSDISRKYGELRASLEKKGKKISDFDLIIGSIALLKNLTLVTNNEKHFFNVKRLKLENWRKV